MKTARLVASLAFGALMTAVTLPAGAQSDNVSDGIVKIGVLTDMSGVYSEFSGNGSVLATQMAIEDFGGKVLGKPIEFVYGDHQSKADIGANVAREWYESGKVDAILEIGRAHV